MRALILAAGASSRMGRPKAALPLTTRTDTLLRRLIHTCQAAGLPDIVVVTGAAAQVVRKAAGPVNRAVQFVHNESWEDGQLSSLLTGLRPKSPSPIEAIVVLLVDVPFVSPNTIRQAVQAWRRSNAAIVRPARGDEHGHPVIFDRSLFTELREADQKVGAKQVVRRHEAEILNVVVDDPGAFLDLDTEEDYQRALNATPPTN